MVDIVILTEQLLAKATVVDLKLDLPLIVAVSLMLAVLIVADRKLD